MQIIYNFPYNIQVYDTKYTWDGSHLEAPTVASGIEPTLVRSRTPAGI